MAPNKSNEVDCEIRIAASTETVFSFFTDPDKMALWKGEALGLDPRPGGLYRVRIADDVAQGEFVEVVPPTRIVFTWGWEGNGRKLVEPGKSTGRDCAHPGWRRDPGPTDPPGSFRGGARSPRGRLEPLPPPPRHSGGRG